MNLISLFKHDVNVLKSPAGEMIFQEGEPGKIMYVILEGEVDIRVGDQSIYMAKQGEIFGEMALIDSKPRSATAVASIPCRLAPVDENRFLYLIQQFPQFSLQMMRMLTERLRRMDANV